MHEPVEGVHTPPALRGLPLVIGSMWRMWTWKVRAALLAAIHQPMPGSDRGCTADIFAEPDDGHLPAKTRR